MPDEPIDQAFSGGQRVVAKEADDAGNEPLSGCEVFALQLNTLVLSTPDLVRNGPWRQVGACVWGRPWSARFVRIRMPEPVRSNCDKTNAGSHRMRRYHWYSELSCRTRTESTGPI